MRPVPVRVTVAGWWAPGPASCGIAGPAPVALPIEQQKSEHHLDGALRNQAPSF